MLTSDLKRKIRKQKELMEMMLKILQKDKKNMEQIVYQMSRQKVLLKSLCQTSKINF
jgi:hypothetical protein